VSSLQEFHKMLKKERSKVLDKEYPGSIGDLQDQLSELKEQVESIEKKISGLRQVEKDLDAAIKGAERILHERGLS